MTQHRPWHWTARAYVIADYALAALCGCLIAMPFVMWVYDIHV